MAEPTHAQLKEEIRNLANNFEAYKATMSNRFADQWKWFGGIIIVLVIALLSGLYMIFETILEVEDAVLERLTPIVTRYDGAVESLTNVVTINRERLADLEARAEMNAKDVDDHIDRGH